MLQTFLYPTNMTILHCSRGAQKDLCAFRGTEGFLMVLGQFDDVESEKIGAIIRILFVI